MFYNIINNNKILFLYIKKHTSVVLINDLYVFKEKNGNISSSFYKSFSKYRLF